MDKFRHVASKYQDDRPVLVSKWGGEAKFLENKGLTGRTKPVNRPWPGATTEDENGRDRAYGENAARV